MSTCVVICVEGVLTKSGESIPTAFPVLPVLQLVRTIANQWPIAYVTRAPREIAVEWLKDSDAPTATWIAQAAREGRADTVLRMLAERRDRAMFVLVPDTAPFASLAAVGATVVTVTHSDSFALGDWRQPSSWGLRGGEEVHPGA
jgi:hypothetical protein